MTQYLVTGGAGFIGSHLSEELVRRGHQVRVADSLVTGKRSNLDHLPAVEFLEGDVSDLEFARTAVAGVDYVLHQAALPSVPRSVKDPITSNRANVDGTLNVLVAARDAGVRAPRLCRLVVGLRQHGDARPSTRTCRRARSRPTRCRKSSGSSTCRCSRRSTGSRR